MILTLKIKMSDWWCQLEIEDSSTFEDLHYAIQDAVEFDDDHLYEFYLASSRTSRNRITVSDYEDADEVRLKSAIPIQAGKKLFYLFDFGDHWVFQILPSRKTPFTPVKGSRYPRLLSEGGEKPEQYAEWDE